MKTSLSALLVLASIISCAQSTKLESSFEGYSDETVCDMDLLSDEGLNPSFVNGFNSNRVHIASEFAATGDNSIRVDFPATGWGTSGSGAQAPMRFEGQNDVYSNYAIRLSENFSYGSINYGGKLPGLAGGANCSGGSTCNGSNGFTARLMFGRTGGLILYLYHMDKQGQYGDAFHLLYPDGTKFQFEKGRWYDFQQRVKINTGNNKNGEVQWWIDGIEVLRLDGIRFVNNGQKVDNLYFSTFMGGGDDSYAPGVDCHMWFDDIKVSTDPKEIFVNDCWKPNLGSDQSICGKESILLDGGNYYTDGITYRWYRNGELLLDTTPQLLVRTNGEYILQMEYGSCISSDTVNILADIFEPNLGLDRYFMSGSSVELSSGEALPNHNYQWFRDGYRIPNADGVSYVANLCGEYKLVISAPSCGEVYDEVNVYEVRPITVYASADDGNVPLNTLDGDLSTRWSAEGDGHWIEYDFNQPVSLNGVNLAFYRGSSRSTYFEVQASDDAESYTQVLIDQSSSGTSNELEYFPFDNVVTARYIRIIGHMNNANAWNSISECLFDFSEVLCNIPADNAELTAIFTNIGNIQPQFNPDNLNYELYLPYGSELPIITASPFNSAAELSITQAQSFPGVVSIDVLSEDRSVSAQYTVSIFEAEPLYIVLDEQNDTVPAQMQSRYGFVVINGQEIIDDAFLSARIVAGSGNVEIEGDELVYNAGGNSLIGFFTENIIEVSAMNSLGIISKDTIVITAYNSNFIPGRLEVENFRMGGNGNAYFDTSPENYNDLFRPDEGVDLQPYDNGVTLGHTYLGEWIEYEVYVQAGTYVISKRVATPYDDMKFTLFINDVLFDTISINNTSNWQSFGTFDHGRQITFSTSGKKILKIGLFASGGNINWLEFTKVDNPNIVSIDLNEGCQLLGFSLLPVVTDPIQVFGGVDYDIIKDFNGFLKNGQANYLNSLDPLSFGSAYIACMNSFSQLEYLPTTPPIAYNPTILNSGWNLITALSDMQIMNMPNSIVIVKNFDEFYEQGNNLGGLESILHGEAYFVYCTEQTQLEW